MDSFSSEFQHSMMRGCLAYACHDVGDLYGKLFKPRGEQPTLEELQKKIGDYGVGSYIFLRQAILYEALDFPAARRSTPYDIDKLFKLSEKRDTALAEIAKRGDPQIARSFFVDQIDSKKIFVLS
jgi:hypothetical protein